MSVGWWLKKQGEASLAVHTDPLCTTLPSGTFPNLTRFKQTSQLRTVGLTLFAITWYTKMMPFKKMSVEIPSGNTVEVTRN